MSKLGLRIALSRSIPHSLRLFLPKSPPPQPHVSHPFQVSTQNFFYSFNRLINTSSPDDLNGLIDPDLNFPGNSSSFPDSSRVESEFASLRDSLVDSGAECSSSEDKFGSGMYSNDALLISNAIKNSDDGFGDKTHKAGDYSYAYKLLNKMVNCGCRPGYVVYNILIGGICGNMELPSEGILELAENAYREMLAAGIVLNKVNVSNFAWCLCETGKFEKAYNVIGEMMSKGFIPDCNTYSKVIGFLCNASKVENAFLLFEEMKRKGIVPDVYTYTILIDTYCKAGLIQQARKWFDEMVRDGCSPNVVTYTALIHAYLKARKVSNANELFERMLSEGVIPNVVTFTALIDGHCKAGDIEKACKICARMRGSGEISDVDMNFRIDSDSQEPNIVTYGALIDGCKAHKVQEAHDLLAAMSVEGCEPNHNVYDALIDGFCKAGKLGRAKEVFAKVPERGYNPNVYTYSSLIDRLFKDKRLDLALKVLSKMLENSCPPNVIIYTEMIDGLCKAGKTDEAYKLMMMMEEKGCRPNVVTYTAMIHGFGKAGKVEKCLELLRKMGASGCFDRDFIVNLGLLDEISENDSVPVTPVYRILIDSFCKAGKLEFEWKLGLPGLYCNNFVAFSWNSIDFLAIQLAVTNETEGFLLDGVLAIILSKGLGPNPSLLNNVRGTGRSDTVYSS
ncbi:hypothetical protein TEA_003044 [Camellia sinensis var. sinensis]|uniref:Pentacotripeptide-repeat region of PRORP domain-containing protein n=1 Tax=Camellia sinensis var. sinensis TaxID=542762 RepID=A0A4S4DIR0_CAMSN|nr:hypothetical protein TEA_003044 [Camellia sinensis var. sinensis]